MTELLDALATAARTATGFFWKAGWAFVLGYAISAMIQAFVPKRRLTRYMGDAGAGSIGLATLFGAISSSCSFAALSAARALVQKGAHFVVAVAFMFASTNLVIELGILILIFLGPEYLIAELIGGLVLIAVSTTLIRLTYPRAWVERAREELESQGDGEEEDFSPLARIRSRDGWRIVGRRFFMEWAMVWREIAFGFAVAGFVAVLVPAEFWEALFLVSRADAGGAEGFFVAVENALVAPLVAAATFIGSMGNIPLATVLASGGVTFAGLLGFIYSDLMVPPLVKVNARYYGWRLALYVAAIMYASIVVTALVLNAGFGALDAIPTSTRAIENVTRFAFDYTFYLNVGAVVLVLVMAWLSRSGGRDDAGEGHDHGGGGGGVEFQTILAWLALGLVAAGWAITAFG